MTPLIYLQILWAHNLPENGWPISFNQDEQNLTRKSTRIVGKHEGHCKGLHGSKSSDSGHAFWISLSCLWLPEKPFPARVKLETFKTEFCSRIIFRLSKAHEIKFFERIKLSNTYNDTGMCIHDSTSIRTDHNICLVAFIEQPLPQVPCCHWDIAAVPQIVRSTAAPAMGIPRW